MQKNGNFNEGDLCIFPLCFTGFTCEADAIFISADDLFVTCLVAYGQETKERMVEKWKFDCYNS